MVLYLVDMYIGKEGRQKELFESVLAYLEPSY